ncbi:hypothetical protein B0H34DRAFT_661199 [Crassisporium funariophilum]|nr:hypothetical protein B0H34DRAFT_661199 [Crassisporium funariophilum]
MPQQGPQTSTLSQAMIENAKAKIKKLLQKRSFEDRILEIQEKNIEASDRRELEDRVLKKRRLLMEEFKLKIWTIDEYQEQIHRLDDSLTKSNNNSNVNISSSTISPPSPASTPTRPCAASPVWNIERESGNFPSSDDFYA